MLVLPMVPQTWPATFRPAAAAGTVAHEFFHHQTGNRVTVRDWFQLTLKEGLTVFREQVGRVGGCGRWVGGWKVGTGSS